MQDMKKEFNKNTESLKKPLKNEPPEMKNSLS
jgi:hypothetical protein